MTASTLCRLKKLTLSFNRKIWGREDSGEGLETDGDKILLGLSFVIRISRRF